MIKKGKVEIQIPPKPPGSQAGALARSYRDEQAAFSDMGTRLLVKLGVPISLPPFTEAPFPLLPSHSGQGEQQDPHKGLQPHQLYLESPLETHGVNGFTSLLLRVWD